MGKSEKELLLKGVELSLKDLATYSRLEEEAIDKGDSEKFQLYNTRVERISELLKDFIKDLLEEREGE